METANAVSVEDTPTSMLGGIAITMGTAVGAGMFALPTISSGMWFGWSVACMFLSWLCMYHSSLMILEVNLHFPEGVSFDTLVRDTLGKKWNVANGLILAFLFYVLDYAYISGGGSIIKHTLSTTVGLVLPQILCGLLFTLLFALLVWLGTKTVDRVVTVLVGAMLITFAFTLADLSLTLELKRLLSSTGAENKPAYFYFVFAALPLYLTSFGFQVAVPSLVKYYGKKPILIGKSMLIGSLLCFGLYLLWLMCAMGNLQREDFLPVVAAGGNVGVLIAGFNQIIESNHLADLLNLFANMAIVSSFLGVSLALFDFMADKFKMPDTGAGRFRTALLSFTPPLLASLAFPDGFIHAIGYAGLALAITGLVVPCLMVWKSRRLFGRGEFTLWGGSTLIFVLLAVGLFYAICHVLAMLDLLPVYGKTS